MKQIVAIVTILAVAGVAWAAPSAHMGNVVRDEQYHNEWGYRDWQAYEGNIEMADLYWGLSSTNEVSFRFTPGVATTFDTVVLSWRSGGTSGGTNAPRNVSVWIEGNQVMAAPYHAPAFDPCYNTTAWGVPDGVAQSGVGVVAATCNDMVTKHNVGVTNLLAGTTYHIRVSAAPADVAQTNKLRLRTSSKYGVKFTKDMVNHNYNSNSNYRNLDGNCGCALTPATTQQGSAFAPAPCGCGDDCMAVLWKKDIIDPFGTPTAYNKWCEGEIWNDGIEDYVKYKEPRFDLEYYDTPVGMGQGTDARTPVAVTQNWYGEKFVLKATGSGCSPPSQNPPEEITALRMYVRKATAETQNLTIGLLDGAGVLIAQGSRLAASIPDFYDTTADGVTPVTDWGWVTVGIPATMLVPGNTYIVAAKSAGTGYEILQQDFALAAPEINSTAASYDGFMAQAWNNGVAVPNSDALFLIGVPEPATLALIAIGGLALIRRRR